jgi:hypothetical protein
VLWAILNSPVANAYAYCCSSKRDVLVADMRQMPFRDPNGQDFAKLEQAVSDYLAAARSATTSSVSRLLPQRDETDKHQFGLALRGAESSEEGGENGRTALEELKFLHWRVDTEVLRLYALPAAIERKLLDLFSGVRRRGVPFQQTEYFPPGFTDLDRLDDLMAITVDWPKTNRRRADLMDLEETGHLTAAETTELENLQRLADASVSLAKPAGREEIAGPAGRLERRQ